MQIISNIALISINETLIVQLISFLIFLFIINRVMFRPLQEAMEERDGHLQRVDMEIADAKTELENLAREIKYQEEAAKKEAYRQREESEISGQQKASEILTGARYEINALRKQNRIEIETELVKARREVQVQAERLAINIMEKLLDRKLAP